jgi:hypothetical protein
MMGDLRGGCERKGAAKKVKKLQGLQRYMVKTRDSVALNILTL